MSQSSNRTGTTLCRVRENDNKYSTRIEEITEGFWPLSKMISSGLPMDVEGEEDSYEDSDQGTKTVEYSALPRLPHIEDTTANTASHPTVMNSRILIMD